MPLATWRLFGRHRATGYSLMIAVMSALVLLVPARAALAAPAALDRTIHFEIPAQPLERALLEFSRQASVSVFVNSEVVKDFAAPAVNGDLSAGTALAALLKPSGLTFTTVGEMITVSPREADNRSAKLIRTAQQDSQAVTGPAEDRGSGSERLEQVVVTAQKREERLQEVPVPVTAIDAAALTENNETRLMDYYTQVPGLIVSPANYSSQLVAIRGVTTGSNSGAGTPTTGIMVDEVPFGNSTGNTPGFTVPDFDPGDLARIEVLRGPQGTLYGASSMGGLIKYVTIDPSTAKLAARLEAGTNSVRNGDELGYVLRGSLNVPLSETLAIRGSAFTRLDPGYIDNPVLGIQGVNEARAIGGRLVGLWKPTEIFSLRLSANYQEIEGDGTSDFTIQENVTGNFNPLGDLQQGYIRGIGPYTRKAAAYGAVATLTIGSAELTSVTGYNRSDVEDSIDYTHLLRDASLDVFGVGGAPIYESVVNSRFSQELRLAFPLGDRFTGFVGAYYDDEEAGPQQQRLLAADPLTTEVAGVWLDVSFPSTYREHAMFADLTWHVTDRIDVQFGGRKSWLDIRLEESVSTGAFVDGGGPATRGELEAENDSFTYLLTPRWKISETQMLYARFASGYRPGGPNIVPGAPDIYEPDKTENYELGFKAEFLGGTVSIDTSIYHIDWKRIQLNLVDPATLFGFTGNAGEARSQGVEFSVGWQPLDSLTIGAWVAYNDARLTTWPAEAQAACEDFLGACAAAGSRLPLSPHFSSNVSVDQRIRVTDRMTAVLGGDLSYVGSRKGVFPFNDPSVPRQEYPAYARTDLRAGIDFDAWRANLYINNVFDRRGLVSGGAWTDLPYSFYYIQPRTIGLSVAREF
jgi:iron complex outermembrane recepter protein